ncbi:hypothetical protein EYF80_032765 [Liparis tanakae]|uniref:Uncharacterized protein n=1 Tax=Liparis tanakae TaxID=230148 RepID=A0A4Z2GWT4_9TELE|nr:hypothetical protein EYF80_032765 [Liparis tanakae]
MCTSAQQLDDRLSGDNSIRGDAEPFSRLPEPLLLVLILRLLHPLTSIAHGSEDVFRHIHDGVRGLVVTSDGLSAAGVVADVLQQVAEGLAHHAGRRPDLLQELAVVAGRAARLDAGLHGAVHQLSGLDKLLLTHGGADGHQLRGGQSTLSGSCDHPVLQHGVLGHLGHCRRNSEWVASNLELLVGLALPHVTEQVPAGLTDASCRSQHRSTELSRSDTAPASILAAPMSLCPLPTSSSIKAASSLTPLDISVRLEEMVVMAQPTAV